MRYVASAVVIVACGTRLCVECIALFHTNLDFSVALNYHLPGLCFTCMAAGMFWHFRRTAHLLLCYGFFGIAETAWYVYDTLNISTAFSKGVSRGLMPEGADTRFAFDMLGAEALPVALFWAALIAAALARHYWADRGQQLVEEEVQVHG